MVKPSGAPANVFMISLIFGDLCPLGWGIYSGESVATFCPPFVHLRRQISPIFAD
jgi:CBS domain containing-hemolysin-like protein